MTDDTHENLRSEREIDGGMSPVPKSDQLIVGESCSQACKAHWPLRLLSIAIVAAVSPGFLSANEEETKRSSPIVVELFTSEGCSSCPPADKLLKSLSSDDTLVLSFHVDYWNQLGWRDPFSSQEFTIRQRQYAVIFGLNQVYTPQMIVGGESEFVGSNKKLASSAIAKVKQVHPPQSVRLTVSKAEANVFNVKYATIGATGGVLLNLAAVQKSASSKVTTGENARANLAHVNVVRNFKSIPLDTGFNGETQIEFPADLRPNELIVVGYLQDKATGKIGAAAQQAGK